MLNIKRINLMLFCSIIFWQTIDSAAQTVVWSEDWEGNWTDNWSVEGGTWNVGNPTSGPSSAYLGSNCAATVLDGNYRQPVETRLIRYTSFTVPAASENPRLRVYHWFSFSTNDFGEIQVREIGGDWQTISERFLWSSSGVYTSPCLDLKEFANKRIEICFYFKSLDDGNEWTNDVSSGWYVDDISFIKGPYLIRNPDNFEGDIGDWSISNGSWEWGQPKSDVGPGSSYSPDNCFATVLDGNYSQPVSSRLTSPPIQIPTFEQSPALEFWQWFNFSTNDSGWVEVDTGDGIWQRISVKLANSSSDSWSFSHIDLSQFSNMSLRIAFYFCSRDDGNEWTSDVATGWYIDDFKIKYEQTKDQPPFSPTNLTAELNSQNLIDLSWTHDDISENGFILERKKADKSFTPIDTLAANTTTYTDSDIQDGIRYYYQLKAFNSYGESDYSNTANVLVPMNAPSNLRAWYSAHNQVQLVWEDNSQSEFGYTVERKSGRNGSFVSIADLASDAQFYSDTDIEYGIEYFYRVQGFNQDDTSDYSNIISPSLAPLVSTPDTTALSGQRLTIPIRIMNGVGIAGMEMTLFFDPALLTAEDISTTPLTSGFTLTDSVFSDHVSVALANAQGLTENSGAILNISFLVNGEAAEGDTCSLRFQTCRLFDEYTTAIEARTESGVFTVGSVSTLYTFGLSPDTLYLDVGASEMIRASGKNQLGDELLVDPDWTVHSLSELGLNNLVGYYENAPGSSIKFTASRQGDGLIIASEKTFIDSCWVAVRGLAGDINADSTIDVRDAISCLRLSIELPVAPFPPGHSPGTLYEQWVADMNQNKEINADDAYQILLLTLENLFQLNKPVQGIGPVIATLQHAQIDEVTQTVAIKMDNRKDISSARLILEYDSEAIKIQSIQAAQDGSMIVQNSQNGQSLIAMLNPNGLLNHDQEMLILKIRQKDAMEKPDIKIQMDLFDFHAQSIDAILEETLDTSGRPCSPTLAQNYPNPFNGTTVIRYQLVNDSSVSLVIYNSRGQVVKSLVDERQKAGEFTVIWDGSDNLNSPLPSGVYFYNLITRDYSFSKKMVYLQ